MIKRGMDAHKKGLAVREKLRVPAGAKIAGASKEDSTATGTYESQVFITSGMRRRERMTKGIYRGIKVTRAIRKRSKP